MFFVISGFFLMSHFLRDTQAANETPELSALRYLKGRIARVLPHHIFAWVCIASIQIFVTKQYSLNLVLSKCAWDFLLLRATGLGTEEAINGVTWYLSAMLIGSYLIYWVLCRNQLKGNHVFIYIYAPLVFFFVMSFIWGEGGHLNYWTQISHVMTYGFWRSLAEMGLGCMACAIVEHFSPKSEKRSRPEDSDHRGGTGRMGRHYQTLLVWIQHEGLSNPGYGVFPAYPDIPL